MSMPVPRPMNRFWKYLQGDLQSYCLNICHILSQYLSQISPTWPASCVIILSQYFSHICHICHKYHSVSSAKQYCLNICHHMVSLTNIKPEWNVSLCLACHIYVFMLVQTRHQWWHHMSHAVWFLHLCWALWTLKYLSCDSHCELCLSVPAHSFLLRAGEVGETLDKFPVTFAELGTGLSEIQKCNKLLNFWSFKY